MRHDVVLSGNLHFLSLSELLQLLGSSGGTGTLRLKNPQAPEPGLICLSGGRPVNASSGHLKGLEALYSLFGWTGGEFEFVQEKVLCDKVIHTDLMEIILDGLRMLDEGHIKRLGPEPLRRKREEPFKKNAPTPLITRPLVQYVNVEEEEEFPGGSKIVEEGKYGRWMWVLLKGEADVLKETPDGAVKLFRIGQGAYIGNLSSIIKENSRRLFTIVASGAVQAGLLDSRRLHSEYSELPRDLRNLLTGIDIRLNALVGRVAEIYSRIGGTEASIRGARPIIEQGTMDERLFQILSGEASILRNTDHGAVLLARLNAGNFVGRVPFLEMVQEPRGASVWAPQGLELMELNPRHLQKEYDNLSATFKGIVEFTSSCISVTSLMACRLQKELPTKRAKSRTKP